MSPKELSEIKARLGDWMGALNALGSDAHEVDRQRANDLYKLVEAMRTINEEEQTFMGRNPDGTARLCNVLYGREMVGKYIGGSNAVMIHDAADKLFEMRHYQDALETVVAWAEGWLLRVAREALGISKEDFVLKRKEFQRKHPYQFPQDAAP